MDLMKVFEIMATTRLEKDQEWWARGIDSAAGDLINARPAPDRRYLSNAYKMFCERAKLREVMNGPRP